MGIFNRSKVPSADAVRLQGGDHTTGYTFTAQINDLNAELREARAQIAAKDAEIAHLDKVLRQVGSTGMDPTKADELAEARAQIAARDAALRQVRDWLSEEAEAHATEIAYINYALIAPVRETSE